MKTKTIILTLACAAFLIGCGAGHLGQPFASSDGYGSVTVNQDSIRQNMWQEFLPPTLTSSQAETLAWQKCSNWEFEGIEPFGSMRQQAVQWGPGLQAGQQIPLVVRFSLDYQCTGNPANQ